MMIRSFQRLIGSWCQICFGVEVAMDKTERNHRFIEEALELVQSLGCTREEAHSVVDYVFNRPKGDAPQEVGGTMVTLAALCAANGLDLENAARNEMNRISEPAVIDRIRQKQAAKPKHSPLPGVTP